MSIDELYCTKGEKEELKEIYKNVKNAIYNWNGDCEIDRRFLLEIYQDDRKY